MECAAESPITFELDEQRQNSRALNHAQNYKPSCADSILYGCGAQCVNGKQNFQNAGSCGLKSNRYQHLPYNSRRAGFFLN
jgi:hypothetical protein